MSAKSVRSIAEPLTELHARLGYQRLNRTWAKLEIVLGLTAATVGLFVGDWSLSPRGIEVPWVNLAGALVLVVLGAYLALAGHRSHLYQSANERTALLIEEIRSLTAKDRLDEHPR